MVIDNTIISGFFALAGTLIGGLISYAITRIDRRWSRAERQIAMLCDQVAAFYQLEQLYKEELSRLDGRNPKTILEEMRSKVEQSGEYERPILTSRAAAKIRSEWS